VNGVDITKLPGLHGINDGEIISGISISAVNRAGLMFIYVSVLKTFSGACDSDGVVCACCTHHCAFYIFLVPEKKTHGTKK